MVDPHECTRAARWLHQFRRPLLVSHQRPDGDALGALAGVFCATRTMALRPTIALFDPFPRRYELLRDLAEWQSWNDVQTRTVEFDCLVIVDTSARSQLVPLADFLDSSPPTLVIDHHATGDPLGTRDGDERLCDPSAAAACLIVAEWHQAIRQTFDRQTATALFTGIATDTGWFRFSNTDRRTLQMAAVLAEAGAQPDRLYRAIYEQDPPQRLALVSRALGSLRLLADGKLAVMELRQRDFAAAGADQSMTEDLINEAGRLAGIEALAMFTEMEGGVVRINLRSKEWLDVSAIAQRFGGGGHARAAGARVTGDWDATVQQVLDALTAQLAAPPA